MADRWYVAQTLVGREDIAELNLSRQAFHVWMPRQTRVVRHARRRLEKRVSFFPGYIFVLLDVDRQRWRSVNGTFGVCSLVMQGGERPLPCPKGLVEGLQALTNDEGIFDGAEGLRHGDAVRVISGPLAELVGTLIHHDGAGRARILLQMMQGQVSVALPAKNLVPVASN
ncbi:transcription termination/antitermination NusG family protein [Mesorhizobium sp.]|uniref:transcription termination/antitermination protein NusG n=1 Tax=Mesorhizobium sp. TaxID=1871066 RepID=UPI0025BCA975|nr:transcription termination/antitermination NusG family protein [Mesorhizobium sp.]